MANAKATKAKITLVTALLKSKTAYRRYRNKQFNRLQELLDQKAIDARLVDESMDNLEAAIGSEEAGKEACDNDPGCGGGGRPRRAGQSRPQERPSTGGCCQGRAGKIQSVARIYPYHLTVRWRHHQAQASSRAIHSLGSNRGG